MNRYMTGGLSRALGAFALVLGFCLPAAQAACLACPADSDMACCAKETAPAVASCGSCKEAPQPEPIPVESSFSEALSVCGCGHVPVPAVPAVAAPAPLQAPVAFPPLALVLELTALPHMVLSTAAPPRAPSARLHLSNCSILC